MSLERPPPPPRTRSATTPTAAAPSATAATPAAISQTLLRLMPASASALDRQVVGAGARLGGEEAGRELLGQLLVGCARLGEAPRVLQRLGRAQQRLVARQARLRVAGERAIGVDGLVHLPAAPVDLREPQPRQVGLEPRAARLDLLERLLRLGVLAELHARHRAEVVRAHARGRRA